MNGRGASIAVVCALACAPLIAQYSPYIPTPPQQQQTAPGATTPLDPFNAQQRMQQQGGLMGGSTWQRRTPFDPIWTPLPKGAPFQGFPVLPPRLSGYGSYPTAAGLAPGAAPGAMPVPLLPPVDEEDPGWPGWLRLRSQKPLPFASDLGLLVRHSDRVWFRLTIEDAFVPLYHHDKLTTLGVGAEVRVRQAGEFELLLHDSTRLIARGPTDIALVALSPTKVEVDMRTFTWVRLQVRGREHMIKLPDGSQLYVADDPVAAIEQGPALVMLRRADEPARYGGRATMFNAGGRTVVWRHAFGEAKLEPGHMLTLFLVPPAAVIPAPVVLTKASLEPDGDALRCTGEAEGRVSWCGASFDLGPGKSVRLDPVLGRPFAPPDPLPTAPDPLPTAPADGPKPQ